MIFFPYVFIAAVPGLLFESIIGFPRGMHIVTAICIAAMISFFPFTSKALNFSLSFIGGGILIITWSYIASSFSMPSKIYVAHIVIFELLCISTIYVFSKIQKTRHISKYR